MTAKEPERVRRSGAAAALVAAGGAFLLGEQSGMPWGMVPWQAFAIAAGIALAGVGLTLRSLRVQLASQAVAWFVFTWAFFGAGSSALRAYFSPAQLAVLVASGVAILLARPMLHTDSAKDEFAPRGYRTFFSSGMLASITAAMVYGTASFINAYDGHPAPAIGFGALAAALLASAIGVYRMRAWGVLLGGVTSIAALVVGLALHDEAGVAIAFAALPGLFLTSPILLARLQGTQAKSTSDAPRELPLRVETPLRVALGPGEAEAEAETDAGDAEAPARKRTLPADEPT